MQNIETISSKSLKLNTMLTAQRMIDNLKKLLGFRTDAELAQHLDINQTTLSAWKARDTFDIVRVYPKISNINLNWLLTGEGDPYEKPSNNALHNKQLTELEIALSDLHAEEAIDEQHKKMKIELLQEKIIAIERLLRLL